MAAESQSLTWRPLAVSAPHHPTLHLVVAPIPDGSARLSAEEWTVWALNANFRPELSFLLRDVQTGTAAGILLTVCWEADTAATGIRGSTGGFGLAQRAEEATCPPCRRPQRAL